MHAWQWLGLCQRAPHTGQAHLPFLPLPKRTRLKYKKMALFTTVALLVSVAYLVYELVRRKLDRGDSDAVATVFAVPFYNRPELKRADQSFIVDLEYIRKVGSGNGRGGETMHVTSPSFLVSLYRLINPHRVFYSYSPPLNAILFIQTGKKNIRYVNPFKPWDDAVVRKGNGHPGYKTTRMHGS